MPLAAEHPTLVATTVRLVDMLGGWDRNLTSAPEGNVWLHHLQFAERTDQLASQLEAILDLADAERFPSALALARTALEHHLLDRLLLLSDRYEDILPVQDSAQLDEWETDWDQRTEPWTREVVSAERTRKGNGLRVVRLGHEVKNSDGEVREHVSPYWRIFEEYDALVGQPDIQKAVNHPFRTTDDIEERSRRNQKMYSAFVKWRSLRTNLQLNALVTDVEAIQLEVHYAFLSAFIHATKAAYELGRAPRPGVPTPHLLGELALLYVATCAIQEVQTWAQFVQNRPHLLAPLPAEIMEVAAEAQAVTNYFWFLGGGPQPCDVVQEGNRRASPLILAGKWNHDIDLAAIELDEVTYYPDPFDRLAQMHIGGNEMTTGFGFAPTWRTLRW